MKKFYFLLTAAAFVMACKQAPSEEKNETKHEKQQEVQEEEKAVSPSLTQVWETDAVLTTNESVLYDPKERLFFVSNIDGQPTDKDGKGFISKLATDGSIVEMQWVSDLDAPKGMAIFNGKLYVTNIDELVEIDLKSGDITERYRVAAALFLNDVAVGEEKVFFSDMKTGRLHLLANGMVKTLAENMENLNGLAYHNGHLYALSDAGLLKVSTEDGSADIVNSEINGGDGLVVLDDETFIASRWKGEIWFIGKSGTRKLLDSKAEEIQTADIGFMPEEKLLLVPRFFSNKVTAYKLAY